MLKKKSKNQLEDMIVDIFYWLFHDFPGKGDYHKGWMERGESIIKLCHLEKYCYNGK